MSETIVQKKIGKLIQKEISEILQRGGYVSNVMITVSVVRMSPDLGLAKIYLTVFPDAQLQSTVDLLNESAWKVRKQLGGRIRNKIRKIPEIRFYVDDSFIEAEKIDKILSELDIQSADEDE